MADLIPIPMGIPWDPCTSPVVMRSATHCRETLTGPRVFGDLADKSTAVEHRWIVVDVSKYHPHLGVTGQWWLYRSADAVDRLVVCQHVEVPDGSTSWCVTVQGASDKHLARVRVNDKRTVVGKLTRHSVTHSRLAIHVRISCANLNITNCTGGLNNGHLLTVQLCLCIATLWGIKNTPICVSP